MMVFRRDQDNEENEPNEYHQVNQSNEESKSENQVYNQHREAPESHYL